MKTKITLGAIAIALACHLNSVAQIIDWTWSKNATAGTGVNQQNAIAVDSKGNTIVTGYFNSSTITFGTTTLTNPAGSQNDMFLVKYDVTGKVLWARNGNSSGKNYGLGLTVDATDNIYLSGYFNGATMTFGSTVLNNAASSSGYGDSYIAKYDSSGNVIWASCVASNTISNGMGGLSQNANAVYGVGSFQASSITFGSSTLTNTNSPNQSPFLVKYNKGSGSVSWARNPTGNTTNVPGVAVSSDQAGNVYVAGDFTSPSLTFGTITINNTFSGTNDIYVAKYDSAGNIKWAENFGGSSDDYCFSISTDGLGNVYMGGYFKSATMVVGSTTLTNAGTPYGDSYIIKLDANGNVLWAQNAKGSTSSNGIGCVYANSSGVYGTGSYQTNTLTFGTITVNNANAPTQSCFVVKYDAAGNVVWATSPSYSSGGAILSQAVQADNFGNVSLTGYFASSSVTFGSTPALTNSSSGSDDIFTARLYDSSSTVGIAEVANPVAITVYPNPCSNYVTVAIKSNQFQPGKAEFKLYDMLGREVMSTRLTTKQSVINRNNLPSGIYLYRVADEKGEICLGKLVIE